MASYRPPLSGIAFKELSEEVASLARTSFGYFSKA
jgi:hypothetical protein